MTDRAACILWLATAGAIDSQGLGGSVGTGVGRSRVGGDVGVALEFTLIGVGFSAGVGDDGFSSLFGSFWFNATIKPVMAVTSAVTAAMIPGSVCHQCFSPSLIGKTSFNLTESGYIISNAGNEIEAFFRRYSQPAPLTVDDGLVDRYFLSCLGKPPKPKRSVGDFHIELLELATVLEIVESSVVDWRLQTMTNGPWHLHSRVYGLLLVEDG